MARAVALLTIWAATRCSAASEVDADSVLALQQRVAQLEEQLEAAEAKLRRQDSCGATADLDFLSFLQRSERGGALLRAAGKQELSSFWLFTVSILEKVQKFISKDCVAWSALKACYNSVQEVATLATWKFGLVDSCEPRETCPGGRESLYISVDTMLTFVRGLSRLYADNVIGRSFAKGDIVYPLAPGSSIITSDYDMELVGPGASKAAQEISAAFADSFGNLGSIADTNLYLGPSWLSLDPPIARERGELPATDPVTIKLEVLEVERKLMVPESLQTRPPRKDSLVISLPLSEMATEIELEGLARKVRGDLPCNHGSPKCPVDNFKKVLKRARTLEAFYYQPSKILKSDDGDIAQILLLGTTEVRSQADYWELVLGNLQDSVESYVAVSTVLAVVVGIQGKKLDLVVSRTKVENWVIAALENLNDLVVHYGTPEEEKRKAKLIDTSKYVFRFLTCVNVQKVQEKVPEFFAKVPLANYLSLAQKLVDLRGKKLVDLRGLTRLNNILELYQSCVLGLTYQVSLLLMERLIELAKLTKRDRAVQAAIVLKDVLRKSMEAADVFQGPPSRDKGCDAKLQGFLEKDAARAC